jgi:hypothetical protein
MILEIRYTEDGLLGGADAATIARLDMPETCSRYERLLRERLSDYFTCEVTITKSPTRDDMIIVPETDDDLRAEHDNWLAAAAIGDEVFNEGEFWCHRGGGADTK